MPQGTTRATTGENSKPGVGWSETYIGGDIFAEMEVVKGFTQQINAIQRKDQRRSRAPAPRHGFHAKPHAGIKNAEFRVVNDLPAHLQVGFVQPDKKYPATIRFSNASGLVQADTKKDLRGIVFRVHADDGDHDYLMTNGAVSHARDVIQFMGFGAAGAGSKLLFIPRLLKQFGVRETVRMLKVALSQVSRKVESLAEEQYWSRAPYKWGDAAIRFTLVPQHSGNYSWIDNNDPNYLRLDLVERLKHESLVFLFQVQLFINEQATPIEDHSVEWKSEFVTVAELYIPQQDLTTPEAQEAEASINKMDFNPWYTTDDFRPLGNLNRARRNVYRSSAGLRTGRKVYEPKKLYFRLFDLFVIYFFGFLNKFIPWHKLPGKKGYFAALNLLGFRLKLREENLYDTEDPHTCLQPNTPAITPAGLMQRTSDGECNDLTDPRMGSAGTRMGRNVPIRLTRPDIANLMHPNPRLISERLLKRNGKFKPAATLHQGAAWWIQFMIHDWFFHDVENENPIMIPLGRNDAWGASHMSVRRTAQDRRSHSEIANNVPPVYQNRETHWWDGSQIYGRNKQILATLRTYEGGRMKLDANNHLYRHPETMLPVTGFTDNMSLGLCAMHELFTREHNAICTYLAVRNPGWSDEDLFQRARLINVALMAKIHTVEWTTAILGHPALDIGMNANWTGLATERLQRLTGRLSSNEAISGIPGSPTDQDGVPFTLTEEFASVYRMHPLVPDELVLYSARTGLPIGEKRMMKDLLFHNSQNVLLDNMATLGDIFYSFGISHPGAITLNNHPDFMFDLAITRPDGSPDRVDLGAIDILRDRERGVPRYNLFRQCFHRPPVRCFEDVTDGDKDTAALIRSVYGIDGSGKDNIDLLDLMVGLYAENLPYLCGFSDTAFRVFIHMASRRLEADRLFTVDFTPEIYGQDGMDYINNNGFASVVLRHCPELAFALRGVKNPFAPWHSISN
jgi:hypothetical protein